MATIEHESLFGQISYYRAEDYRNQLLFEPPLTNEQLTAAQEVFNTQEIEFFAMLKKEPDLVREQILPWIKKADKST